VNDECASGDSARLAAILARARAGRVLLFTGGASYESSGAASAIGPVLDRVAVERISSVTANPTLEEIESAIDAFHAFDPDLVIAVGGGSVIDLAKAVRLLANQDELVRDLVVGLADPRPATIPLVAIPTTSGTGSEATHFAVVYVDGVKYSLTHDSCRPDFAILDPLFTYTLPRRLTAITGLDALSQAMESLWSVQSTRESQTFARRSLTLAFSAIGPAVHRPSPRSREDMFRAAHLSGRAIDISMTTASHALSYDLTINHGVPHGHAVALTLGALLEFNAGVTTDDCLDPRGVAHVTGIINEILSILGARDAAHGRRIIEELVASLDLDPTLEGVGAGTEQSRTQLVQSVNAQRLANNPRRLTNHALRELVDSIH
jgi:alcohol dehydrogenase class IV